MPDLGWGVFQAAYTLFFYFLGLWPCVPESHCERASLHAVAHLQSLGGPLGSHPNLAKGFSEGLRNWRSWGVWREQQ